jgi:hypothetical protein
VARRISSPLAKWRIVFKGKTEVEMETENGKNFRGRKMQ